LGINLLGALPNLPARARGPLPQDARPRDLAWQNRLNEAVDAIRTRLLHESRAGETRVIMVTSAVSGEGKTSLAGQLAASLARAWKNTLLVDGDLRHPAAHRLFDASQEPGFSELLRGEVTAAAAVRPTPLSRLWLMPAGQWDSHAVQALAQDQVKSLLTQLKEHYDFVVIDSCPVLPVADSLLLGQHVDAVVFSVLRDVSRIPAVHAAGQRLSQLGIRVLGAVAIGVNEEAGSSQYVGGPASGAA
jgi:capsular exopolysaccharide synthesis family protein